MAITIRSLHIYPVKGCAAVDVDSIGFDGNGLIAGDRRSMIVDVADGAFVSQRHEPRLATLRVDWRDGGGTVALGLTTPDASFDVVIDGPGPTRRVTVWDDTFDAIDLGDAPAAFLGDWLGRVVRLVALPPRSPRVIDPYWAGDDARSSFADLAPILVASTASLDDLNVRRASASLSPIEMARFRPNVVLDGLEPWMEDRVGSLLLRRGMASQLARGVGLRMIKPCARCGVIELDPTSGDATADAVLSSLASFRAGRTRRGKAGVFFGQNAVVRPGSGPFVLRVGEPLRSTKGESGAN